MVQVIFFGKLLKTQEMGYILARYLKENRTLFWVIAFSSTIVRASDHLENQRDFVGQIPEKSESDLRSGAII